MSSASSRADSDRRVSYREARPEDFPILINWYTQLNTHFYRLGYRLPHPENVGQVWLESFQRTLGRFSNVFIAEVEGKAAGFMLCRLKRVPAYMGGVLVGELSDMWIEADARRMGIGDRLSRLALAWLREQGAHSVEIQVLKDNEASWKLYERMGFQLEFRLGRLLWDEYVQEDA
ncbi:MAG TPA: GNAT family N-acetyltransferase [Anaerolineales bacterium]|nr:GNAT family N-acetyltransferase [Anaerolineales bacterium]